jgi:cysteine synthase
VFRNLPADPKIYDELTQCVGNTPLVRLRRITAECEAAVLAKIEGLNPLASLKDRVAWALIDTAERAGSIGPDTLIVEPTSGNMGIGLAFTCAARGYKLAVTMPENVSFERRRMLRAMGARLVLTPAAHGMRGAIRAAEELSAQSPNSYMPQQFNNPANPEIHRKTTAEEIWRDTAGAVDIVVAGVGTGGTITGVAEGLKSHNPAVRAVAVEPFGSPIISQHLAGEPLQPGKHALQGLGAGFIPKVLNLSLLDDVMAVRDEDAIETTRQLACQEGLMCGISSGAATWAAIQLARSASNRGKQIVVILPDGGERYLSTSVFAE